MKVFERFSIRLYDMIEFEKCIYDWYRNGIRQVSDIFDEHGNFYDFDYLKDNYGMRRNFFSVVRPFRPIVVSLVRFFSSGFSVLLFL